MAVDYVFKIVPVEDPDGALIFDGPLGITDWDPDDLSYDIPSSEAPGGDGGAYDENSTASVRLVSYGGSVLAPDFDTLRNRFDQLSRAHPHGGLVKFYRHSDRYLLGRVSRPPQAPVQNWRELPWKAQLRCGPWYYEEALQSLDLTPVPSSDVIWVVDRTLEAGAIPNSTITSPSGPVASLTAVVNAIGDAAVDAALNLGDMAWRAGLVSYWVAANIDQAVTADMDDVQGVAVGLATEGSVINWYANVADGVLKAQTALTDRVTTQPATVIVFICGNEARPSGQPSVASRIADLRAAVPGVRVCLIHVGSLGSGGAGISGAFDTFTDGILDTAALAQAIDAALMPPTTVAPGGNVVARPTLSLTFSGAGTAELTTLANEFPFTFAAPAAGTYVIDSDAGTVSDPAGLTDYSGYVSGELPLLAFAAEKLTVRATGGVVSDASLTWRRRWRSG